MKKSTIALLCVLGGLVILVVGVLGWSVSTYNGIVAAETKVEAQAADIQTYLQRRSDLIPNLVSTVKGYAAHEEGIFTEIADARSRLMNAGAGTAEQKEADTALSSALSRLLVIVEQYPDLKANQNFIGLQDQLEGTENRIAVARKDYNAAAKDYNQKIRTFPANLIAGMFGKQPITYFEASEQAQTNPTVDFSK